eukprot:s1048_g16.t1
MGEAFHEDCAMAPLQFARLRPSGFRQAFSSAGKRRSAYWLCSLWLLAAFFACLWCDVLTFTSSSSATGRSSRSLLQAQQKEWSGAPGLQLGVAKVSQVLSNFAPQVSSIVVTSMVLLGVMGAAGSNDGTAGGPDWNTNVQVSVSKQQGTSDDGTAWSLSCSELSLLLCVGSFRDVYTPLLRISEG